MHDKFKALLEEEYVWPAEFHFKFIVPTTQLEPLTALLDTDKLEFKASRNQKYTSVNAWMKLASSDEVVYVYEKVKAIPGIIAL